MICGAPLDQSEYCQQCGCNVSAQKEAFLLSRLYYNQGLEKAQVRDLSGAITCLKRSLKMNKLNISARNLLGLAYFETGEVVAALSEWVISKNMQPEGNAASGYIQELRSNANRLETINQTIKKYNQSLTYCRQGNLDMAKMQLKKVLSQNSKLIKGYHLLALLYLREESYEKARRLLKNAAKIDKTNTTTLRFLQEIDEQTGKKTSLESRFRTREKQSGKKGESTSYYSGNDLVIQPPAFRESSTIVTLMNVGFGLLVGAATLWFLVVPAKTQSISQEANTKVAEYSDKVASQRAEITRMEESIASSEETVNSANDRITEAGEKSSSYESLIKAYAAMQEGSYTTAANAMQGVNSELLSVEAKAIYNTIFDEVKNTLFKQYFTEGVEAYESQDFATAITQLTKAQEIDDTDYETMYYLAHSYLESGDNANARIQFQKIIDNFPDTKRATDANDYLETIADTNSDTGEEENAEEESTEENTGEETGNDTITPEETE